MVQSKTICLVRREPGKRKEVPRGGSIIRSIVPPEGAHPTSATSPPRSKVKKTARLPEKPVLGSVPVRFNGRSPSSSWVGAPRFTTIEATERACSFELQQTPTTRDYLKRLLSPGCQTDNKRRYPLCHIKEGNEEQPLPFSPRPPGHRAVTVFGASPK